MRHLLQRKIGDGEKCCRERETQQVNALYAHTLSPGDPRESSRRPLSWAPGPPAPARIHRHFPADSPAVAPSGRGRQRVPP